MVTGRITGHPVRIVKNRFARQIREIEMGDLTTKEKLEQIEEVTKGSFRKAVEGGDMDQGSVMSGQIAGLIKEKDSVENIIHKIIGE